MKGEAKPRGLKLAGIHGENGSQMYNVEVKSQQQTSGQGTEKMSFREHTEELPRKTSTIQTPSPKKRKKKGAEALNPKKLRWKVWCQGALGPGDGQGRGGVGAGWHQEAAGSHTYTPSGLRLDTRGFCRLRGCPRNCLAVGRGGDPTDEKG